MSQRFANVVDQVLLLEIPPAGTVLAEASPDQQYEPSVVCPVVPGHRRRGPRKGALSVLLPPAAQLDFVWTWFSDCLVTSKVVDCLQKSGLRGFEVRQAKVRLKDHAGEAPSLWELVVTGWAGIAPSDSGIRLEESCPACGNLTYTNLRDPRRLFDPNQWDGSDCFMIWPLPRYIFVSSKVFDVVRNAGFTGARFRDLQSMKPDEFSSSFSPGRLSYWMPDPRAHELGDPLGIF